jgi:hypothetical protein
MLRGFAALCNTLSQRETLPDPRFRKQTLAVFAVKIFSARECQNYLRGVQRGFLRPSFTRKRAKVLDFYTVNNFRREASPERLNDKIDSGKIGDVSVDVGFIFKIQIVNSHRRFSSFACR